ncbi:MAG: hypothetical protein RBS43_01985, partial [Candidatus Cloacimonas sp.]|nr:hypothetical protein [Candidatus Cloacimonas sp.]
MKKLALVIMIAAISISCFAGIDEYYSFNATTITYAPITGTAISSILQDDELSENIPIGFTFPYGDASVSEIKVSSNGWIGVGTTLTDSNLSNSLISTTWHPVLAPLWDDTSLSGGTAEYLSSGTAPNRVCTIQFGNMHWNYSSDSLFNYQVKLYESGKISFTYGASAGAPNFPSASIGINMAPGGVDWFLSVTPGAIPTVSQTAENANIEEFPASGTVYEFLPVTQSPNDLASLSVTG